MSGGLPIEGAVKDAPVDESREKKTMEEFCEQLQYKLEDYWIDISDKLDEARDEYEIVDEAGNSVEHKVDWGDFDACPFIDISYRGELLTPQERVVSDFERRVNECKETINSFWVRVRDGKCIKRGKNKVDEQGVDFDGFGKNLYWAILSFGRVENALKTADEEIADLDISSEEKRELHQKVNDLFASVRTFIQKGEE